MADDDKSNENEDSPPAKPGKLMGAVMMLLIALVAGGGGFAVPYLMPAEKTSDDLPKPPLPKPEANQAFVPFGATIVNLDEGRLNRYLRISITLQVDKSKELEVTEIRDKNEKILKSWLLSYLANKSMEDIRGAVGQNRLRREIQDHFNTVMFPDGYDQIHDILFDEFNIQ